MPKTNYHEQLGYLRASAILDITTYVKRCGSTRIKNLEAENPLLIHSAGVFVYVGNARIDTLYTDTLCLIADMLNQMP